MARKKSSTPQPGEYNLVPAGLFSVNHSGMGLYVRYCKNPNRIDVVEMSPRHVYIKCPDRDLYLVSAAHHASHLRPSAGTYDKYVNLSLFHDLNAVDHDIPYYMVNYTQSLGKEDKSHGNRRLDPRPIGEKQSKIISDSGGFQILMGRTEYIDPLQIIQWYNENVDVGLILDIPTFVNKDGLLDRLARIQQKNTQIMLDNKRDTLELMNIFHGHTPEDVRKFREITEHPDINRLAFGASYLDTVMSSLGKIAEMMHTGKKYDQYHMLGVANLKQVYPLIYMAKKGFAPEISSDASTWLQESTSKGYYHQEHISEPPGFIKMFDKVNAPSPYNTLPCNCPVCSNIKYTDALSVINGNVTTFLMAHHNMYAYNNVVQAMKGIMAEASLKEIKELVARQFRTRSGKDEALKSFDFIESISEHGVDSSYKKFGYYLNSMKSNMSSNKTLFGKEEEDVGENGIVQIADDDPRLIRTLEVCDIYEGKTERKHGAKNANAKKTGHLKASSGAKGTAGKRKKPKKVKAKAKDTKKVTTNAKAKSTKK
ncbi:TGT domain-containing protein [Vibrio phage vB_VcorM_GR7B]|nr:TGT domain-containing protein [Vibrio phage vB_VcorM_GR7B]